MKFITVFFVCAVVLTATAYPQSRSNNKLKNKPKSSRQELPPATPTPVVDKTVVSQNTSQVLTIASNSTPSVVASTESPKAGADVSSVVPPSSVVTTVTTVAPPKSTTVAPKNATTTAKPDEDDEDDEDSSEEEEDADVDSDVEEGDFEGPPGPPGPPGPEGDLDFEGDEEDDDDDRAADQSSSEVVQKPSKKNKKGANDQEAKIRETSGGIDAYVPGYVTDQGEVLVPIDTLERGLQYTIISDRFVSIPQKKSHLQRKPVYLYRQEPSPAKPASQPEVEESSEEEPPPEVYPVKVSETSVIFATKAPPTNDTQKEEQITGNSSQSSESQEDEDEQSPGTLKTAEIINPPLGVIQATKPTGEDDEDEVVGTRRSDNRVFRRNFYHPSRHFAYSPQFDYVNNLQDNRRVDYPYSPNFYRSFGRAQPINPRYNSPYGDVAYEDSLEDFGRSDFEDY